MWPECAQPPYLFSHSSLPSATSGPPQQELQDVGQLPMVSLTKKFNFPIDFLTEVVERRLGAQIDGQLAGGQLYTEAFVQRHHARVRAAFGALTRPTPVRTIVQV